MPALLTVLTCLFVFAAGLSIGSFVNVLAYRIPKKLGFVRGRSFCPACGHALSALDLVPLASFAFLSGRCRYCGARISPRYPLVELLGGALALLCAAAFGFTLRAALAYAVTAVLLTVALIDADTMEIPDGLVTALALLAALSVMLFPETRPLGRLIGVFAVSAPMLLIDLLIPTSFGGGDVKLAAAAGLLLGWKLVLVAAFVSILTGGAYGAFLLMQKKMARGEHFAFGPFLCFGVAFSLLIGSAALDAYLSLFRA